METARPLIGRQAELRLLDTCLDSAAAGSASVVMIRGEAGIGKSRLVEAVIDRARTTDALVSVGHCTPVSGSELPFGPFVEMLSAVARARDDLDELAGATWQRLRAVLTVSETSPGVAPPDVGLARSWLFTSVLQLLHLLGERQLLVCVVEDVHWADSSSLDLLNYLARTAGQERLLLVVTCRDEAVARDSPAYKSIAELRRADRTRDVRLRGLDPEEVRELLADSAVQMDRPRQGRIVDLADGNPFIALELASHDDLEGDHTEALRHALLGPVHELPDDARSALHVAAVLGQYIPHEVLEASIDDPAARLRLLTERGLLLGKGERYVFRHAIVRENVVKEMLPSERVAAHRAAVRGMRASRLAEQPSGFAQLAHHLVAAGDHEAALPAVMCAAGYARDVYAFAEAHGQLLVARRQLWDRVDDPEKLAEVSFFDLVCREAEMARWAGRHVTATELLRDVLATRSPDGADRAQLEHQLGDALWAAGDTAGSLAAYERGRAALQGRDRHGSLSARLLASLARGLTVTGQYDRGAAAAEEAIALAHESGEKRDELHARITLATVIARRGDLDEGSARLRQCLHEALDLDAFEAVVRCYGNLAFLNSTAGRLGAVLQVAREGASTCQRFGPLLLVAPTLVENWVHALVATGRWTEAEQVAQELTSQWPPEGMALALHLQLAYVAAARGDADGFEQQMAVADQFAHQADPYTLHDAGTARAEHLLWRGDAAAAYRVAHDALEVLSDQQDAGFVVSMCSLALRAHADLVAERSVARADGSAEVTTDHLLATARAAAREDVGPLGNAHLLLCEAEASRARGADAADQWAAVADEWQRLERPYPAAYARWRQAESLFAARARTRATRSLVTALQTSVGLGCSPLEEALRKLARYAGVRPDELTALPEQAAAPEAAASAVATSAGLPVPLTPREKDVLLLLTTGLSNQQIARRLFITESTVSVHVSHILSKLGVSNRLQAAAAAHRLNLVPLEPDAVQDSTSR